MTSGPLAGITVLDVSQAVTGPYTAWLLSGMGARVIKLEGPLGDQSRWSSRAGGENISPLFVLYNGGKESITLNLKTDEGCAIFKQLVAKVDVVIENFVPGTMEGWDLQYDVLAALNPGLIYASISGFGRDSKYASAPGLDMTMQAMSGVMAATGFPDSPPTMAGVLFIDTLVAPHVAAGILAALHERNTSGKGQRLDVAMRDVAACMPFNLYNVYFNTGRVPKRTGNLLTGFSPGNLYPCADGHVYIACNTDKQAKGVFDVIGQPELMETEGFRTRAERWRNHEQVDAIVEAWTHGRAKADVFETMIAADVPCGVVQDIEEVLNDPDLNARGVFTAFDQPGIGPLRLPRSPIIFDTPAPAQPGRLLGEDNEHVYGELLGFDRERLRSLAADGVITEPAGGFDG